MSDFTELTETNFDENVKNEACPVVVDFYAPWCGSCRKLGDMLSVVCENYKDKIKVYKVNIDEAVNLATAYSVSTLPTVLVFKDGEPKERIIGLVPKSTITANIEKHL